MFKIDYFVVSNTRKVNGMFDWSLFSHNGEIWCCSSMDFNHLVALAIEIYLIRTISKNKDMKTDYQKAKDILKDVADMAKSQYSDDKPMIRQILNDSAYFLQKEYSLNARQIENLHTYVCKLHP